MEISALVMLGISGIKEMIKLVQGWVDTAKQSGELTPEAEAAWKASLDAYRASPAGTPTSKGKL